jgi:type VI secretion system secreted protein Hcp
MAQNVHLFLKVDGREVKGESTETSLDRASSIECFHYAHGAKTPVDWVFGEACARRQYEPLEIRKRVDAASPLLWQALTMDGRVEATFRFYRPHPSGSGVEHFYTTIIKGYVQSIKQFVKDTSSPLKSDAPLLEEVCFVHDEVFWTFEPTGASHLDTWAERNAPPPAIYQPQPLAAPSNFVEIELLDEAGAPVPGESFTLVRPDGKTWKTALNSVGRCGLPIGGHDQCMVTFDNIDPSQWKPKNREASTHIEQSAPSEEYEVKQGDCLSSIAYKYGLSCEEVWNDPGNSALKDLRNDPYVLFPGDRVVLPARTRRWEDCSIADGNTFIRRGVFESLRYRLTNADGSPRAGLPYSIKIDSWRVVHSGWTGKDGAIECRIPPDARRGTLSVEDGGEKEQYDLLFGHLDPLSEISGVQARLSYLGHACGAPDGVLGPRTRAAIQCFQKDKDLQPTGELDEATRAALMDVHRGK